ncbi:alpha/beta hydrolase [Kribbella sandramycini]|uniref:Alpha/beta hydrolase n=1 Tax=Kribbella sandramycini TaxID=60450 RepID=A0A7Y4L587_9ACTN|nr:alpha/beta hydrolase [Kribbella sandramycini]MBB6566872.1 pimeloyl-ACP methyl ester carboxylesterase [Kribbella sandramycini]NOL44594.1 alpha/beta hydrolase [Kribbella sandramycini]
MFETDLRLPDGRVLRTYDSAPCDDARLAVVWCHGTPNLGAPPVPLFEAGDWLGIRWISFDRPGYGGSTAAPGRGVAAVAADLAAVVDAAGIDTFALMGYSGGGTFALGAAALLPERVEAVATFAAIAPYDAAGLDWYDGMLASGRISLRAAAAGRAAKLHHETFGPEYDLEFTPTDLAMFDGPWSWLGSVAGDQSMPAGPDGLIDDDCAYVRPWGCDLTAIQAPTLLCHGEADRIIPSTHARWLAAHLPSATLDLHPHETHISILNQAEPALEWLRDHTF